MHKIKDFVKHIASHGRRPLFLTAVHVPPQNKSLILQTLLPLSWGNNNPRKTETSR